MTVICDVGPRDGLQSASKTLAPEVRAELVDRLARAGLERIEAVSFVDPVRVPQMDGAEQVIAAINKDPRVCYTGLILNERGYDRLVASGLTALHYTFGSTDSFNLRNSGRRVHESLEDIRAIAAKAKPDGVHMSVAVATAFGCPFEGPVSVDHVLRLAEQAVGAGAAEIFLADTIGVAVPGHVLELVARAQAFGKPVGVHLHNTRNTGYVNAYVALEAGASILDASIGGVGGCPFAPRATGNIATEDLVYILEGEGVATGIDLGELIDVAVWLEGLLGQELAGQLYRVGSFPAA